MPLATSTPSIGPITTHMLKGAFSSDAGAGVGGRVPSGVGVVMGVDTGVGVGVGVGTMGCVEPHPTLTPLCWS